MDVSLNLHDNEHFLEQFPLGSFLQSRFWAHFLDLQGKKNWQLNVYSDQRVVAHCLLYSTNLFFGKSYLYAPKGPLISPELDGEARKEALELILSQIRDITIATRRREEIFCRLEPNLPPPTLQEIPHKVSSPVQPAATSYLSLERVPDELLASFKEKTRYNIRLAQRKGLEICWSQSENDLKHFFSVINKTSGRQKIKTHDRRHYQLLLRAGQRYKCVWLQWTSFENKPIAANLYVTTPSTMTYLHGGFDYHYRDVMAPYLLQWQAILKAKEWGLQYYDFWGVEPKDGSKPSWAGFSRFKRGFCGREVSSPGAFDFIYNPFWHNLYEDFQDLRQIWRPKKRQPPTTNGDTKNAEAS